jgi:hypothetical protein
MAPEKSEDYVKASNRILLIAAKCRTFLRHVPKTLQTEVLFCEYQLIKLF